MKKMVLICILSTSVFAELSNESELTIVTNGGNTQQETWNGSTKNTYTSGKNSYTFGGHYSYGKSGDTLSSRNWDLNIKYKRDFGSTWSGFVASQRESDRFANIDYRWNHDFGAGLKLIDTEDTKLISELGLRRALSANNIGSKSNSTSARLFSEVTHKNSESLYLKFWAEYLPNFKESDDWLLNFEPSMNFKVSTIVTVKIAYKHKYDNLPEEGFKKSDYQYLTSLIAKF